MPNAKDYLKAYNGTSDFGEWYKQQYGKDYNPEEGFERLEGMTDGDWAVGQSLYGYYKAGQTDSANRAKEEGLTLKSYEDSVKRSNEYYDGINRKLEGQKNVADQNADITYRRLAKYLPMQARAQGLGGTYAETAAGLKAYNTYMNTMSGNAATHASAVGDNERSRTVTLGDYEKAYNDSMSGINRYYNDRASDRDEAARTAAGDAWQKYLDAEELRRDNHYQDAQALIGVSDGTTVDAVLAGIDTSILNEQQKSVINQLATAKANANAKAQITALQDTGATADEIDAAIESSVLEGKLSPSELAKLEEYKADNPNIGGATVSGEGWYGKGQNIKVEVGGQTYKVQFGEKTSDSGVVSAGNNSGDGKLFVYNGNVYYKIKNSEGDVVSAYVLEPEWLQRNKEGNDYNKLKAKYAK